MLQVTFWCSPIRSLTFFLRRLCFHDFGPPNCYIETKPQLSFAASVLKDKTNFLLKNFSTSWSLLRKISAIKSNAFFPFTYNPMIFKIPVVLQLIQNALCFKWYSRPKLIFAWQYCFTRELWKKSKSDNSQFPIILARLKNFSLIFFG